MSRSATFAIPLLVTALACGGSAEPPTGPAPASPAVTAPAAEEIAATEARISASEVGAVSLAFDLEEDQRQAIADALARARAALGDLAARWRAGEIDAATTVAEARAINAALDAEIASILTPEQRAELDARRAAWRPGLELTEGQRAEIQSIVDGWYVLVLETLQALRRGDLTPAEAARSLADGAREARAAVCGVLEPEQLGLFPSCPAPVGG
jgi:Spy/CpxP family protein refolding chaperone